MGRGLKPQGGASLGTILIIIALVVFFGNLAVQMVPAYLNFWQVRASMKSVHAKDDVRAGGPGKILAAIQSQLYINDVRAVGRESFHFEPTKAGWVLTADYDVQKPVFENVDVVMHFSHSETYQKP